MTSIKLRHDNHAIRFDPQISKIDLPHVECHCDEHVESGI